MKVIANLKNVTLDNLNQTLGFLMTQYGVELSEENFNSLHKLLKGKSHLALLKMLYYYYQKDWEIVLMMLVY